MKFIGIFFGFFIACLDSLLKDDVLLGFMGLGVDIVESPLLEEPILVLK